jgi:hypothetical protein
VAKHEEKASAPGRRPKRRRRNTALYVFIAVIAVAVVGGLVAIAILAGTQSGGTPIGDILAKSDWGDELVEVAGTVQEVRAAPAGNMVWYKLADPSGAIWVNAAVEGKSSLNEVGLISGGRIWLPLPGPEPQVGDARRVQALVVSSAPPEGAPADASPYLFPAQPLEQR